MRRMATGCGIVLVLLLAVLALMALGGYNRLVTKDEAVKTAWGQVENVYQRRADLVPNLVETVRGARDFEQETLIAVIEARARVGQSAPAGQVPTATGLAQFQQSQEALSSALSRLLVVVERYPELRATEAFRDLMAQLEGTENRIAVERRRFNEAAQDYNTTRRRLPTALIARLFGFDERPYFQAAPGSERPPAVQF